MNLADLRHSEPPDKSDPAEIARALSLLVEPGSVVELRALNSPRGTISGYFADMGAMAQAAATWSGVAKAVYFTLNPVSPDLLARACNRAIEYVRYATLDEHILRRRLILIDCDPVRPVGIPANESEREAALDRCMQIRDAVRAAGRWTDPIFADSGNGGHLLYRTDLPNDEETREVAKDVLSYFASRWDDDRVKIDTSTFNASRISKLYGTLSAKGDHVPELGRVHRIARILEVPDDWA